MFRDILSIPVSQSPHPLFPFIFSLLCFHLLSLLLLFLLFSTKYQHLQTLGSPHRAPTFSTPFLCLIPNPLWWPWAVSQPLYDLFLAILAQSDCYQNAKSSSHWVINATTISSPPSKYFSYKREMAPPWHHSSLQQRATLPPIRVPHLCQVHRRACAQISGARNSTKFWGRATPLHESAHVHDAHFGTIYWCWPST